jgi:glycosyltransferase involved in cell wall biosynthesis
VPAELPLITVVTPVLNGARTLAQTLASVRAQGYPRLEHVVVDGGSTDGTLELLGAAGDVRWISEPDRGLADAMNKGIAMAHGEVIGWLNADDYYLPGALATVGSAFAAAPQARWAAGRCIIVDGEGREIRRAVSAYKALLLRAYSFPLLLTQNFIMCPATFVTAEAYAEAGPLNLDYRLSMDYDVFLRIARRHRPLLLHEDLSAFRMVEGTLSLSAFETQFAEHHEQARIHGEGHPVAVAANRAMSAAIALSYRLLRARRRLGASRRNGAS